MFNVFLMMFLMIAVCSRKEVFKTFFLKCILILMMIFICFSMLVEFHRNVHSKNQNYKALFRNLPTVPSCEVEFNPVSAMNFLSNYVQVWFNLDNQEHIIDTIVLYFKIIVVATAFTGIKIYQKMVRIERGQPKETPKLVFEDISRLDADESFSKLLKFLINYGFYKFGVEISLFIFISVIFIRHELFAMLYLIPFVVLVFCNRVRSRQLWNASIIFIISSMFLQCILLLAFIAIKSCTNTMNEVKKEILKVLQYLYQNLQMLYEDPIMIVADFVLLITMIRQVRNVKTNL